MRSMMAVLISSLSQMASNDCADAQICSPRRSAKGCRSGANLPILQVQSRLNLSERGRNCIPPLP